MAERYSTGFRDLTNATGSVKSVMANGVLAFFGGDQPTSADKTEGSEALVIFTLSAGDFTAGEATNGLNMGDSTDGVLAKDSSEEWKGVGTATAGTGTQAKWCRWYDNSYTKGADTTSARVDMAIGSSSTYELQASNLVIVEDAPVSIQSFNYTPSAS